MIPVYPQTYKLCNTLYCLKKTKDRTILSPWDFSHHFKIKIIFFLSIFTRSKFGPFCSKIRTFWNKICSISVAHGFEWKFNVRFFFLLACSKHSDSGERCPLSERLEQAIFLHVDGIRGEGSWGVFCSLRNDVSQSEQSNEQHNRNYCKSHMSQSNLTF